MKVTTRRQRASLDPLYESVFQTACRLTTGVAAVHRLINTEVIPARRLNGRHKIAKLAVGELLASAYEIWPPERRPHYSVEELRRLSGITVGEVAAQLGLGRTRGTRPFATTRFRRESSPTSTAGSSRRMWSGRWRHTTSGIYRLRHCPGMDVGPASHTAERRTQ